MYGNFGTQATLASTGVALCYWLLGAGVLIFAGIALITIVAVIKNRRNTT